MLGPCLGGLWPPTRLLSGLPSILIFMDLVVRFCGIAKTSLFNTVFLEGVKSALLAANGASSNDSLEDKILPMDREFQPWTEKEKNAAVLVVFIGAALSSASNVPDSTS